MVKNKIQPEINGEISLVLEFPKILWQKSPDIDEVICIGESKTLGKWETPMTKYKNGKV